MAIFVAVMVAATASIAVIMSGCGTGVIQIPDDCWDAGAQGDGGGGGEGGGGHDPFCKTD